MVCFASENNCFGFRNVAVLDDLPSLEEYSFLLTDDNTFCNESLVRLSCTMRIRMQITKTLKTHKMLEMFCLGICKPVHYLFVS